MTREETINGHIFQETKRGDNEPEFFIYTSVEERANHKYFHTLNRNAFLNRKLAAIGRVLEEKTFK